MIEAPHEFASHAVFARLPCPFWTMHGGRLRTVGTAFLTTPSSNFGRLGATKLDALSFFRTASFGGACAEGKLVFADAATKTISVYQSGRGRPCRVSCGNANAAGAILIANHHAVSEITVRMRTCRQLVPAQVTIIPEADGFKVRQRWFLPRCPRLAATTLPTGQRSLRVTGALNPYLIVEAEAGFDPRPLFKNFLGDHSLRARAAVVTRTGGLPMVRFYNVERAHGAAPQTGLASVAIAARIAPWFGRIFAEGAICHPDGIEPLPEVNVRSKGVTVTMPEVEVVIANVRSHSAASR